MNNCSKLLICEGSTPMHLSSFGSVGFLGRGKVFSSLKQWVSCYAIDTIWFFPRVIWQTLCTAVTAPSTGWQESRVPMPLWESSMRPAIHSLSVPAVWWTDSASTATGERMGDERDGQAFASSLILDSRFITTRLFYKLNENVQCKTEVKTKWLLYLCYL